MQSVHLLSISQKRMTRKMKGSHSVCDSIQLHFYVASSLDSTLFGLWIHLWDDKETVIMRTCMKGAWLGWWWPSGYVTVDECLLLKKYPVSKDYKKWSFGLWCHVVWMSGYQHLQEHSSSIINSEGGAGCLSNMMVTFCQITSCMG